MLTNESNAVDCNDIEPRTERALTECMTVLDTNGTPITDAETHTVSVVSSSGSTYTVNAVQEVCTCPDHQQNHRICKHIRRSRFALGIDELSSDLLRELDVSDNFAAHCPGPIVLASDGGLIGDSKTQVESSKEITGHDQPQRSEKADFGGGESTGIQEL